MRLRSPEDELLLLLVGPRTPDREARLRAALSGSHDWTALLRQADIQGVLRLVADRLQRSGADMPPRVGAELQRRTLLSDGRSLLMAAELRQALQRLDGAAIPVIPLKGVALAAALYGRCTLRASGDIDLLVPRAHVAQAVGVLESAGYEAEGPWRRWVKAAYHIEIPLAPRGGRRRFLVDLQWGLIAGDPRYVRAAEECWAAARPATVLGAPARVMSADWTLMYLALHAARSQWQGLKGLVDIRQACATWTIDWANLWALAERWGWKPVLQLTLEACGRLWELPAEAASERVEWPSWLPGFPAPPRETRWASLRVMGLVLRSWRLRIGYALRMAATSSPNDYRWLPLPGALSPLYLVLRPVRWLVLAARAGFQRGGGVGSGRGSP